jgi:hypothetical protein
MVKKIFGKGWLKNKLLMQDRTKGLSLDLSTAGIQGTLKQPRLWRDPRCPW